MALPLLTQSELVELLADETGWSKSDVRRFFDALESVVTGNVGAGNRVKLPFGVVIEPVRVAARKKRMGRNPQTGEAVPIAAKPASSKLRAKIVKPLKDASIPGPKKLANLS